MGEKKAAFGDEKKAALAQHDDDKKAAFGDEKKAAFGDEKKAAFGDEKKAAVGDEKKAAFMELEDDKLHFFDFDNAKMLYKGDWAAYKKSRPHDNDCSIAESDNWKGAQQCVESWECRGARMCEGGGWCSGFDGC